MATNSIYGKFRRLVERQKIATGTTPVTTAGYVSPVTTGIAGCVPPVANTGWWNEPTVFSGPIYHDTQRSPYRKKFTRLETALYELRKAQNLTPASVSAAKHYFLPLTKEMAIEKLGFHNPIMSGRPTKFAMMLLAGIPSSTKVNDTNLKNSGLFYYVPPLVGRYRTSHRTSLTGLFLLKHWAEKRPKFAPFLAAYLTRQAEDEITAQCVDLMMDILPPVFTEKLERNRQKLADLQRVNVNRFASGLAKATAQHISQQGASVLMNTNTYSNASTVPFTKIR